MRQNKLEKIYFDCLRELYKESTPSGDFDILYKNAELDEDGRKIIPFNDYELEQDKFVEIINKYLKKVPKYKRESFSATIYLGASPRFKSNE